VSTAVAMPPEMWEYNGYFGGGRTIRLMPGVMTEDAVDVFMRGHCHSLALALCELLPDSELMGEWVHGVLEHVFVRLADGSTLDATGLDELDESKPGHWFSEISTEELDEEQDSGFFRRERAQDAMPFAQALVTRYGLDRD
jgi:hypothetical protein